MQVSDSLFWYKQMRVYQSREQFLSLINVQHCFKAEHIKTQDVHVVLKIKINKNK